MRFVLIEYVKGECRNFARISLVILLVVASLVDQLAQPRGLKHLKQIGRQIFIEDLRD